MKAEEIKDKLHKYIDKASDEELREMLLLLEEEIEYKPSVGENDWWDNDALISEMEKTADDVEEGRAKGYSLEELDVELSRRREQRKAGDV